MLVQLDRCRHDDDDDDASSPLSYSAKHLGESRPPIVARETGRFKNDVDDVTMFSGDKKSMAVNVWLRPILIMCASCANVFLARCDRSVGNV